MEQTNSSPSSDGAASELDSDPNWTCVSYENWPSDFVPSENGQQEAWGAGEFGVSKQIVKDFQGELEKSGYKRKEGTDRFSSTQKRLKPSGKNSRKSAVFRRQNQKSENYTLKQGRPKALRQKCDPGGQKLSPKQTAAPLFRLF